MKKLLLSGLLTVCIIFYACRHEPPVTEYVGSSFCFNTDILPIFINRCATAGCHDNSRIGGYQLNTFDNIRSNGVTPGYPGNSKIFTCLNYLPVTDSIHHMPPRIYPQLTETEKRFIGTWIEEGAQNTPCTCDSSQFTYASNIKLIMVTCTKCHKGDYAPDSINLTTYAGVKAIALNGLLMKVVTHDPSVDTMPKNLPKLSDCRIAQLRKWVAAGAPNN